MATVDKNQAIVDFLKSCPLMTDSPLFFNFGDVRDGANQATIRSDDISLHRPYINGSVLRRYTFTIDCFKSVAYNPIIEGEPGETIVNENVDEMSQVQDILDWINQQGNDSNFPIFGNDCVIEKMETLTTKPDLVGVDTTLNPPMAVYRISIQIDYIDNTKKFGIKRGDTLCL